MSRMSTPSSSYFRSHGLAITTKSSSFTVVRTVLGGFLFVAAILKAHQLLASPLAGGRLLLWGEIAIEWVMSLWLLSGFYTHLSRYSAILCFAVFGAIALVKGWRGDSSCGCFGSLEVNPWLMCCFDVLAVAALTRFRPTTNPQLRLWATVFLAVAILSLIIGTLLWNNKPATLVAGASVPDDDSRLILEPSTWIGRRFPIRDYLTQGEDLMRGKWLVLLYHHNCPACLEGISELSSNQPKLSAQGVQLALIEVPPLGELQQNQEIPDTFRRDHLTENKDWIAATPVFLRMEDGIIDRVASAAVAAVGTAPDSSATHEPSATQATSIVQANDLDHDLGYVEPATSHTVRYVIENASDQILELRGAESECSCMKIINPPTMIQARTAASIDVMFDSPTLTGHYSKRMWLLPSNSQSQRIEMRLSARIGLPLRVEPEVLALGNVQHANRMNQTIRIYNDGSRAVKLLYATSTLPGCVVQVSRQPIPPGGSLELSVLVTPNEKWSQSKSLSVTLQTNDPNQPTLQVSANYELVAQSL